MSDQERRYDVALSFAGEDRPYVDEVLERQSNGQFNSRLYTPIEKCLR
jgi:hypothetical protein